jgi:hypothetical protein
VTNPEHLHRALAALAPARWKFYNDEAPDDAVAPWLVGSLAMPEPKSNLAGGSHGGTSRWWVTASAVTAGQARVMAADAVQAWGGARIVVPGYTTSALAHRYANGPYPAGMKVTDTDLAYQVIRLGFDLTASRLPAA